LTSSEKNFLGSMILTDGERLEHSGISPEMFSTLDARKIAAAVAAVVERGGRPDALSLHEIDNTLELSTLSNLTSEIPSGANWQIYAERIRQEWQRRKLKTLAERMGKIGPGEDPAEFAKKAADFLEGLSAGGSVELFDRSGCAGEYLHTLEERYKLGGKLPGISTGFPQIDNFLLGYQAEHYYLIGARTSGGKSAFSLQSANHAAAAGIPVGFISIESGRREILDRSVSQLASVNSQKLKSGFLAPRDFEAVGSALDRIAKAPFYIYDKPSARLADVEAAARQAVSRGAQIVFVDYLQNITVPGARNRIAEVSEISLSMKKLARKLRIPVVCAAQLRREAADRIPGLHDFSDSSQIEKDADAAILLYEDETGARWAAIAKNRDGATGRVQLIFEKHFVRFKEANG
jgi:replicative DNA helicase